MKKIYVLAFALVTMFSFNACSSDDDAASEPSESLIGEWEAVREEYKDFENGELVDEGIDVYGDDEILRVTFNADATFTSYFKESYDSNGEIIEFESTSGGTYTVEGNKIVTTITASDGTETSEVDYSFSEGNLEIFEVDEDEYEEIQYRYEYTTIYKRR